MPLREHGTIIRYCAACIFSSNGPVPVTLQYDAAGDDDGSRRPRSESGVCHLEESRLVFRPFADEGWRLGAARAITGVDFGASAIPARLEILLPTQKGDAAALVDAMAAAYGHAHDRHWALLRREAFALLLHTVLSGFVAACEEAFRDPARLPTWDEVHALWGAAESVAAATVRQQFDRSERTLRSARVRLVEEVSALHRNAALRAEMDAMRRQIAQVQTGVAPPPCAPHHRPDRGAAPLRAGVEMDLGPGVMGNACDLRWLLQTHGSWPAVKEYLYAELGVFADAARSPLFEMALEHFDRLFDVTFARYGLADLAEEANGDMLDLLNCAFCNFYCCARERLGEAVDWQDARRYIDATPLGRQMQASMEHKYHSRFVPMEPRRGAAAGPRGGRRGRPRRRKGKGPAAAAHTEEEFLY